MNVVVDVCVKVKYLKTFLEVFGVDPCPRNDKWHCCGTSFLLPQLINFYSLRRIFCYIFLIFCVVLASLGIGFSIKLDLLPFLLTSVLSGLLLVYSKAVYFSRNLIANHWLWFFLLNDIWPGIHFFHRFVSISYMFYAIFLIWL